MKGNSEKYGVMERDGGTGIERVQKGRGLTFSRLNFSAHLICEKALTLCAPHLQMRLGSHSSDSDPAQVRIAVCRRAEARLSYS